MDVIFVDDEPHILAVMRETADLLGLEAATFTSSREALASLTSCCPKVVVLDLGMPEMDGIEFIRYMAEAADSGGGPPQLVLMSGHDPALLQAAEKLARERNIPTLGTLQKPVGLADIERCLARVHEPRGWLSAREPGVDIVNALPRALASGRIQPHFQPVIDVKTRTVLGFEALARWSEPDFGAIPPGSFIPVGAEHDVILAITDVICGEAFKQLAQWRSRGLDVGVSINLSAAVLGELSLPERLEDGARAANVDPRHVTFEITETEVMQDLTDSLDILTRLTLRSFTLSIDDFGTGYSGMAQLHRIPFRELKIDGTFVSTLRTDPEARAIVETMIMLARRLGMKTVAEGVETREQFRAVRELGCDRAQGFFFAPALPAADVLDWVAGFEAEID